ncbi:beta-hexosaminidase subunit beta-like [Choristoneura fumiferana]|uniref:beta-hexosaminidase subunit beta-like n=1 Tax=Choristoneura fumiferana TaxID=7141 RepID=UPI003D15F0DC
MLRYIIIFNVFGAFCSTGQFMVNPGPKFPPTKGEVWPKPQYENKKSTFYTFDLEHFTVKIVGTKCDLVTSAVDRFKNDQQRLSASVVQPRRRPVKKRGRASDRVAATELLVDLTAPCEDYPHLDMDESYNLTVAVSSKLTSASVWGIIRGLETFSQLLYLSNNYEEIRLNMTEINDYPRYSHRGLLLDTSRHYISLNNIYLTLDAMAMNKMNVFHWHIVDDQSFPYQSEKFPELSEHGAYHPSMVYTKVDIETVVNYARERGIRVLPEIDVPGHTRSWGLAYPSILTECYRNNKVVGLGPMNPIHNATYKLLRDLIQEVQDWFPDKYYHIGGDEVDMDCWQSNPTLLDYMSKNNMSDVKELHALFMTKVIPLLGDRSQPIVWQEVFDENVALSENTLVQIWKDTPAVEREINKVLRAGYKVLYSESWYLDHLSSGGDWESYYKCDPRELAHNPSLAKNIVGGEACMWGEVVDDRNVISRVWPRASAVAEVLWSAANASAQLDSARRRIEEHTCRMIRRDIGAQPPNGPGFCVVPI